MKRTAFIINTARGAIIDEKALVRALKKKLIAGAGLDVFEHEPKLPPALKAMKNVVLTPHLGSAVMEMRGADGQYRRRQYPGADRRPHAAQLRQSAGLSKSVNSVKTKGGSQWRLTQARRGDRQ